MAGGTLHMPDIHVSLNRQACCRLLASGSDDTTVIIWDPFRRKSIQTIPTPHIGNIFSVKFLGNNDSLLASAAGDCGVVVQSCLEAAPKMSPLLDCSCHVSRVKRLATAPEQPLLFWSAGEDGLVMYANSSRVPF